MPKQDNLTPTEVIAVLNRSYTTTREASRRETVDAAQKALDNCYKWLRNHRISYHQNKKGVWVLGKEEETHG